MAIAMMAFDAFIGYAPADIAAAEAACAKLETSGILCWLAARDTVPGGEWTAAIRDAIDRSRVVVIIFSSNTYSSAQVEDAVRSAIIRGAPVVTLCVEDVKPTGIFTKS